MSIEVSDSQSSGSSGVESLVGIEHSSLSSHAGADHELDTISDRESAVLGLVVLDLDELDLRNGPSLVVSFMAFPESHWLVVHISSLSYVKAEALIVSDVPLATRVEVETLLLLSSPWSDDGCSSDSEALASLI